MKRPYFLFFLPALVVVVLDQASKMIASENEASMGVVRDWIKES